MAASKETESTTVHGRDYGQWHGDNNNNNNNHSNNSNNNNQRRSRRKRKILRKWKRKIGYLVMYSYRVALFSLGLVALFKYSFGIDVSNKKSGDNDNHLPWRPGYDGHGTTHEQLGQTHWPPTDFTKYNSSVEYTRDLSKANITSMKPIYKINDLIFKSIFTEDPALPPGYVVVKNKDTLVLGPKVEENDWSSLLAQYRLIAIWVIFLLIFIILMPFIGLFYCCFCCHQRRCQGEQNARGRFGCSICLMMLVTGLIYGMLIAFLSNKLIDRGLSDASYTMRRGSVDTCAFLKDVSDHIYHLFIYNFEELETHITDQLNQAAKHIFFDLADTSDSGALDELDRILDNMPEALDLMLDVEFLHKDLRFYGSQFRDALRGLKRDINWGTHNLCGVEKCYQYLASRNVELLDTSRCLHFDVLPNSTLFVKGMRDIIRAHYSMIPKTAIQRLHEIKFKVKKQVDRLIPLLIRDIQRGRETFIEQATNIRNIIDAVTSDVHLNTLRSTKSFEDVYELFGTQRSIVSIIVVLIILLIIIVLIAGLICGCFGAGQSATSGCNTATGALFLLFGIVLIFCVFSFITLVGLFYFMIGTLTYEGACAPLRDKEKNSLFRQFDSTIDLNRYIPKKIEIDGESNDADKSDNLLPSMRLSSAINACSENQSIFDMLRTNNVYDVNDLVRLNILPEDEEEFPIFYDDLRNVTLITSAERLELDMSRYGNLSKYHSSLYINYLCTKFTPISLITMGEDFLSLGDTIYERPYWRYSAYYSYRNDYVNAKAYHETFVGPLTNIISKIQEKLKKIDKLILYENHDFGTSIDILVKIVLKAEMFIKNRGTEFINALGANLTATMREQIADYIDMVIYESNNNVGRCAPLAYIYYRGVDLICHRLVDPLNGYWFAVLLCSLLFLPVLFVAHRLMCLYKAVTPSPILAIDHDGGGGGCPICTGDPYIPPPIVTCGGGQQTYCGCEQGQKSKKTRISGGTQSSEKDSDDSDFEVKVEEPATSSKHKRD